MNVLRRSILKFLIWSIVVLMVGSVCVFAFFSREIGLDLFVYTLPVIIAIPIFAMWKPQLFRRPTGEKVFGFEAANILTSIRMFLVPPVIVLFSYGYIEAAAILYLLVLLSDVADGYVARKFKQETAFGLMLDPFGDIASTLAVFSMLLLKDIVPLWLYIFLIVRYAEFSLGLIVLSIIKKPPRFRATKPGKAAGLIQGIGILILLGEQILPLVLPFEKINFFLFAALAVAIIIVIVSQTRIGIEAIKNGPHMDTGGQ